ncbi:flagellar hook-length control protein FliK [bacterium]|nr:flagellar hook-length control protein FliK [bacterium]
MISNQVGALDIKSLAKKSNKSSSKEDKADFQNEMIKTEKKKKTKLDGREAVGVSTAHPSKSTLNKTEEAASAKSKKVTQESSPATKGIQPQALSTQLQQTQSEAVLTQQPVDAGDLLNLQISASPELTLEEANLLSKMGSGGFDLQGMQMVKPQVMTTEQAIGELSTETAPSPSLEGALTAIAPKSEKATADLLSQNPEHGSTGFEMTSDLGILQNFSHKEAANLNQAFSNILESKVQGTESLRQANVENLVSQASAIIKDGGGEMTLKLTPEGMGTVDLKVGLQNGQISVEIMTQDQNVKKMFEDSIFDMRGALESQNLKVDTFHVGVSEHFDQSMGQQAASQFAEREFARDFMGQFRDARQSLRQQGIDSFLDNRPGMNSRPEGLSPASSAKNINGRLNIIA